MKKLIFMLLFAVALVGFVSASAAHPPWAVSLEMADQIMAEYNVHEDTITPSSVLVIAMPVTAGPAMKIDRYNKYSELIIIWGEQYRNGRLSAYEFSRLVTMAVGLLRDSYTASAMPGYYLRR
jgi:glycerol-3-phosphate cytidylyltransferase-like family protein